MGRSDRVPRVRTPRSTVLPPIPEAEVPNTKTASDRWWSLFDRPIDRRGAMKALPSVFGLMALSAASGCSTRTRPSRVRLTADPFAFGVASGDPTASGAVLWTRLDLDVLRASGLVQAPVGVSWEVAADPGFRSILSSGHQDAHPELGYSVHVETEGLAPGSDYWYRFRLGDADSSTGRLRTAPSANLPFRFAFASCQNYEHGYFTALRHLAEEDVDLILHLGDYIYESRFPSSDGLPREHESGEVTTLSEYRSRYATYRRDPDLREAHAAAPWVVTHDDHEVDNNWAGEVPEDGQTPEAFMLRRAAAFQAYYEFMPVRRRPARPALRCVCTDRSAMALSDPSSFSTGASTGRTSPVATGARSGAPERSILGPRCLARTRSPGSSMRWTALGRAGISSPIR